MLDREPYCPSSWARLIDEMMAKDPSDRPGLARLARAVDALECAPRALPANRTAAAITRAGFAWRAGAIEEVVDFARRIEDGEAGEVRVDLYGEDGAGKREAAGEVVGRLSRRGLARRARPRAPGRRDVVGRVGADRGRGARARAPRAAVVGR